MNARPFSLLSGAPQSYLQFPYHHFSVHLLRVVCQGDVHVSGARNSTTAPPTAGAIYNSWSPLGARTDVQLHFSLRRYPHFDAPVSAA